MLVYNVIHVLQGNFSVFRTCRRICAALVPMLRCRRLESCANGKLKRRFVYIQKVFIYKYFTGYKFNFQWRRFMMTSGYIDNDSIYQRFSYFFMKHRPIVPGPVCDEIVAPIRNLSVKSALGRAFSISLLNNGSSSGVFV